MCSPFIASASARKPAARFARSPPLARRLPLASRRLLPPLSLSHRGRRSTLALQQRRTPSFPGAVIHLFNLLALAGVMRAALGFIHTVIKARYGSGSDRKPIPRLSLAAPVAAPSKLFHTAALRSAGTRRASLGLNSQGEVHLRHASTGRNHARRTDKKIAEPFGNFWPAFAVGVGLLDVVVWTLFLGWLLDHALSFVSSNQHGGTHGKHGLLASSGVILPATVPSLFRSAACCVSESQGRRIP
jgi:hypothetical protein